MKRGPGTVIVLRRVRFHDLRHTYTSLLIAHGAHPKYIQAQLGHASIQTTLDRYGHLMPQLHQAEAQKPTIWSFVPGDGAGPAAHSGTRRTAAAWEQIGSSRRLSGKSWEQNGSRKHERVSDVIANPSF